MKLKLEDSLEVEKDRGLIFKKYNQILKISQKGGLRMGDLGEIVGKVGVGLHW
jgi:hypothetical protein